MRTWSGSSRVRPSWSRRVCPGGSDDDARAPARMLRAGPRGRHRRRFTRPPLLVRRPGQDARPAAGDAARTRGGTHRRRDACRERRPLAFRHDVTREAVRESVPVSAGSALDRQAADVLLSAGATPVEVAAQIAASASPVTRGDLDPVARRRGAGHDRPRRGRRSRPARARARAARPSSCAGQLARSDRGPAPIAAGRVDEARAFATRICATRCHRTGGRGAARHRGHVPYLPRTSRVAAGRQALGLPELSVRTCAPATSPRSSTTCSSAVGPRRPEGDPGRGDRPRSSSGDANRRSCSRSPRASLAYVDERFEARARTDRAGGARRHRHDRLGARAPRAGVALRDPDRRSTTSMIRCASPPTASPPRSATETGGRSTSSRSGAAASCYQLGRSTTPARSSKGSSARRQGIASSALWMRPASWRSGGSRCTRATHACSGGRRLARGTARGQHPNSAARRHGCSPLLAMAARRSGAAHEAGSALSARSSAPRSCRCSRSTSPTRARSFVSRLPRVTTSWRERRAAGGPARGAEPRRRSRSLRPRHMSAVCSTRRPAELERAVDLFRRAATARARLGARRPRCRPRPRRHPDAAVEAFDGALVLYAEAGATWDAGRVRSRLREHGVRRRLVARERDENGWAAMTDSELAVARLVAQGSLTARSPSSCSCPHTQSLAICAASSPSSTSTRASRSPGSRPSTTPPLSRSHEPAMPRPGRQQAERRLRALEVA